MNPLIQEKSGRFTTRGLVKIFISCHCLLALHPTDIIFLSYAFTIIFTLKIKACASTFNLTPASNSQSTSLLINRAKDSRQAAHCNGVNYKSRILFIISLAYMSYVQLLVKNELEKNVAGDGHGLISDSICPEYLGNTTEIVEE
jgi:hypothetical protein